jgi:hypothetical protein
MKRKLIVLLNSLNILFFAIIFISNFIAKNYFLGALNLLCIGLGIACTVLIVRDKQSYNN